MDLSSLANLRVDAKTKPVFSLPTLDEFKPGKVLAFDQSFSSSGWVHLHLLGRSCEILATGTYKTPAGSLRGGEQDLERAHLLYDEAKEIILKSVGRGSYGVDAVLYETPPKGHGVRSPEVSLLCALSIRLAASGLGIPFSNVHAQTGKKMITGNAHADKKVAHASLMSLPWIEGLEMVTNEGQRDALLVALAHLRVT